MELKLNQKLFVKYFEEFELNNFFLGGRASIIFEQNYEYKKLWI